MLKLPVKLFCTQNKHNTKLKDSHYHNQIQNLQALYPTRILTVTKNFAKTWQGPVMGHSIVEADLEEVEHRLGGHNRHRLVLTPEHAL